MKRIGLLAVVGAGLLCASLAISQPGPGSRTGPPPGPGGAAGGQAGDFSLPVAEAHVSEQYHTIAVGGRLQPQSRIVHATTSAGYIQAVRVQVGQTVREGEELFSIRRKDDVMNLYKPVPVVARIGGRVSEVLVKGEEEVSEGEPAVVILGSEGYLLEATVSDKDAFLIDVGQTVSARTPAGTAIRGVLSSRSEEPDYSTGLFTLTFHFPDSQNINIGEFVTVELPVDRTRGLFVPREAVVRRYGSYFLWIVDEEGRLEARKVVLGTTFGDLVLVREGLKNGEHYLVELTGREREGERIGAPER